MFRRFSHWFSTPKSSPNINQRNFINVQIDAVGVGLASAAAPFLPVFLTRLGATSLQVSLLTAMPAITGFLLAIPIGRVLQKQKKIVPWFSGTRLAVISSYLITGIITFFIPQDQLVNSILLIWAIATLPQTLLAITFSVVMNAVAGPSGRFELMTRRWSILGLTTSITVFIIGQVLDRVPFPYNYPLVFIGLSVGGLISYYFSSHISLPDLESPPATASNSLTESINNYLSLINTQKPFRSFIIKRFVYLTGINMTIPLFPLYFVREIKASDAWIAAITTAQTAILIIGYFLWSQQSRRKGSRTVLLWTTFGLSLYPIFVALTHEAWLIAIFAGLAGIFQAGLDLVFFDELMRTVPVEYSATFVSFAQGIQYLSTIIAPLFASSLVDRIGIAPGLIIAGGIRLIGFVMFSFNPTQKDPAMVQKTQIQANTEIEEG